MKLKKSAKKIVAFSAGFESNTSVASAKIFHGVVGYSIGLYRAKASACIRNRSGRGKQNHKHQQVSTGGTAKGGITLECLK